MEQQARYEGKVKSVGRSIQLVETIHEREGASLEELVTELDLARSTVHNHLKTLYDLGYLVKEDEVYQIGTRFLQLGEYSRTRRQEYTMAAQVVTELTEETEERAQFVIEEHGQGVFLYRESGSRAVETNSGTGKRMYLHATAAGKAILMSLPDSRVREILDQWGLPEVTEHTITDEATLFDELERSRERGYTLNEQENIDGLCAVGVPVKTGENEVIGALSISMPAHRFNDERIESDLSNLLLGTANELELNIIYS